MKKWLMVLFMFVLIGNRVVVDTPVLYNVYHSSILLLTAYILARHMNKLTLYLLLLFVLPDFFREVILLISPNEPDYNLLCFASTFVVLAGSFKYKYPIKWNY
jgi:hypothetical protein